MGTRVERQIRKFSRWLVDLKSDDPALIVATIGDIAPAQGMNEIARGTGIGWEAMQKSFRLSVNPTIKTLP